MLLNPPDLTRTVNGITGRSTFYNYYSGLGHLVATEWDNDNNAAEEVE